MGTQSLDLSISNGVYDPKVGAKLYNRYLDEKNLHRPDEADALILNEHHSTPFCIRGVTNVGASILARETKQAKDHHPGQYLANLGRSTLAGRATGDD